VVMEMSGVEASREPKESQVHACTSCVSTVVQTFNHFQEQIVQLQGEKMKLEGELRRLIEEWERQRQAMTKQIRKLEEELAALNKK
jgi:predicted RNase H-like nuclease (RuvC/YqgF family)